MTDDYINHEDDALLASAMRAVIAQVEEDRGSSDEGDWADPAVWGLAVYRIEEQEAIRRVWKPRTQDEILLDMIKTAIKSRGPLAIDPDGDLYLSYVTLSEEERLAVRKVAVDG